MNYERKDDKLIEILKDEVKNHQENDFAQHEEIRRLNVLQGNAIQKQGTSIEKLTLAMFGDVNEKGTKQKVDEIYEILVAGGLVRKVLAWAFGVIMALVSSAYMIFNFIKDIKKGD